MDLTTRTTMIYLFNSFRRAKKSERSNINIKLIRVCSYREIHLNYTFARARGFSN